MALRGEDRPIHDTLRRLGATEEEAEDLAELMEEEGVGLDESGALTEPELLEWLERYRAQRSQEEID